MEPMNAFLASHRQEFKDYVDEICSISTEHRTSTIPPSYATPITILGRLPGTSREGFPSLPYLLDQARECAGLIDVWLDTRKESDPTNSMSEEMKRFDILSEQSRAKAKQCLTRAEQAERPSGTLEPKWEELVNQMERKSRFRITKATSSPPSTPVMASAHTENSSSSSLIDSYFPSNAPRTSPGISRLYIASSPSSSKSPEDSDPAYDDGDSETETPPGSASSIWDPGVLPTGDLPTTPPDMDDVDLAVPDDQTAIGSSIYSLTPTSKRTSTSTNSTIQPKPIPLKTPSYTRRQAGPRSEYSLRRSSDRADISSIAPKGPGTRDGRRSSKEGQKIREGRRSREDARIHGPTHPGSAHQHQHVTSMCRIDTTTTTSSQNVTEPVGTPRSPGSRDCHGSKFHLADFGTFFGKKVKEREKEEGRKQRSNP